jgi:hypothetical protein
MTCFRCGGLGKRPGAGVCDACIDDLGVKVVSPRDAQRYRADLVWAALWESAVRELARLEGYARVEVVDVRSGAVLDRYEVGS